MTGSSSPLHNDVRQNNQCGAASENAWWPGPASHPLLATRPGIATIGHARPNLPQAPPGEDAATAVQSSRLQPGRAGHASASLAAYVLVVHLPEKKQRCA